MNTVMDRLYLELANVVSPETKTARELKLEAQIEKLREAAKATIEVEEIAGNPFKRIQRAAQLAREALAASE